VLAGAALALSAVACGSTTTPVSTGVGGTRVVEVAAGENFWGSISVGLGGAHAHVVSVLTNPNTDPHDYEPTPADARTVAGARYVIANGLGYDPWITKLVAAEHASGQRVLDVGDLLGLRTGANPHRWYFPGDVGKVIDRITADLQKLDPADATYFAARRADYLAHGLALYHALLDQIASTYRGTPIGASESIVVGLARGTGLDLRTPPAYLNAISEGDEPTAADKAEADHQIAAHEIEVFVYNRQNATPDVRALVAAARARHIPVVTVTETMVPASTTFAAWQSAQLEDLAAALATASRR
jgi:zinc/manganese transport system substrate-binding protein